MSQPTREEIQSKVLEVLAANDAFTLASTGGEYSPWVLGAYFVSDGLDLYSLIETHGKTMTNLHANKQVAFSVSQNDATKDFLQGSGVVTILGEAEEPWVRDLFAKKMPWFKTYTPVKPVKIQVSRYFVSSFSLGWFPAKILETQLAKAA